jgi:hypothetical protein
VMDGNLRVLRTETMNDPEGEGGNGSR